MLRDDITLYRIRVPQARPVLSYYVINNIINPPVVRLRGDYLDIQVVSSGSGRVNEVWCGAVLFVSHL